MTIGPALLFIAWWGNSKSRLTRIISVYGRVAFFYYILHFFFIHSFSVLALYLNPGEGFSLGIVYIVWIGIVALLYPFCYWYDKYKTNHKEKWWLSYL
jgi:peptidoglycan/LPS O-acetylase OafA/YrhL